IQVRAWWLPQISLDEEFSVFDNADVLRILDSRGWLYGIVHVGRLAVTGSESPRITPRAHVQARERQASGKTHRGSKAQTDDPNSCPLVQKPSTEVGQQPLAQNRWTIEKRTDRNDEDRAKPDRKH